MIPEPTESYIEFREPRTIVELEEMLKLRYSVRRSCHLAALCPENEAETDIDEFDRYAYHVGLFALESHRFVPVGYSRFVLDHPGPQEHWVKIIAKRNGLGHKLADPSVLFPCLKYMPEEYGRIVRDLYQSASLKGQVMGENCGAVLREDIRSVRVANRWIESIVGYLMIYKGVSYGTTVVATHHAKYYGQFGFKPLSGIATSFQSPFGPQGAHICLEHLPTDTPTAERVYNAADELVRHGKVVISSARLERTKVAVHHIPTQERAEICSHA